MVEPNRDTIPYAIRDPRPDLMKPPDSQNAMAISQGISDAKAEKAAGKVRVLVSIDAPRPSIATAPSGMGLVMIPTIVPRKMASKCHA